MAPSTTTNRKRQGHNGSCYFSLACSIGSIGIACGSLLQLNSTSDRISLQRGLFLTSLGFIHFVSLTDFFNKYFLRTQHGERFRRKYRLMVSDVMDITNKIVSAVQASFSFLAGLIACKSSCSKSFLYASHFIMEAYAWFGTAYFMYDIWSMYKVHVHKLADKLILKIISSKSHNINGNKTNGSLSNHSAHELSGDRRATTEGNGKAFTSGNGKNNDEIDAIEKIRPPKSSLIEFLRYIVTHPVMIIHHVFLGTMGLLTVTYLRGNTGDCVYSFIYMMEFSTPFVSIRSILSTMGLKDTRIYVINGLVMLFTFFLCRIFMWPYVFYRYSQVINRPVVQAILGLPRNCLIGISILFLPQVYWFYLMLRGALKVFFPKKTNSKNSHTTETKDASKVPSVAPNRTHNQFEEPGPKRSVSPVTDRTSMKRQTQGRSLL